MFLRFGKKWNENNERYHDLYLKSDGLLLADMFELYWCVRIISKSLFERTCFKLGCNA